MKTWSAVAGAVAIGCGLTLFAPAAHAADPRATSLFQQGVKLVERGEIRAACEKFEQSYQVDPAPGTLGNLATCWETLGEYSRAHKAFTELAKRAQEVGKTDRATVYHQRAAAIEPKLPKIALGAKNAGAWTELTLDEVKVPKGSWAAPIAVEEGPHTLRLVAGETTRVVSVNVPHEGTVWVELPSRDEPQPVTAPAPNPAPVAPKDGAEHDKGLAPLPLVLVGAGGIALGVGGFFGIRAIGQKSDATDACPAHKCFTTESANRANDARSSAVTSSTLSTVFVVSGVVLVGAGAVLYFLSRRHATNASTGGWPTKSLTAVTF